MAYVIRHHARRGSTRSALDFISPYQSYFSLSPSRCAFHRSPYSASHSCPYSAWRRPWLLPLIATQIRESLTFVMAFVIMLIATVAKPTFLKAWTMVLTLLHAKSAVTQLDVQHADAWQHFPPVPVGVANGGYYAVRHPTSLQPVHLHRSLRPTWNAVRNFNHLHTVVSAINIIVYSEHEQC